MEGLPNVDGNAGSGRPREADSVALCTCIQVAVAETTRLPIGVFNSILRNVQIDPVLRLPAIIVVQSTIQRHSRAARPSVVLST